MITSFDELSFLHSSWKMDLCQHLTVTLATMLESGLRGVLTPRHLRVINRRETMQNIGFLFTKPEEYGELEGKSLALELFK